MEHVLLSIAWRNCGAARHAAFRTCRDCNVDVSFRSAWSNQYSFHSVTCPAGDASQHCPVHPFMKIPAAIALLAIPSLGLASGPADRAASGKDPTDATAAVAPTQYSSPFARYRPFSDNAVGSWREANDEVARIGGWKAYAREVFEANEAAKAAESTRERKASPPADSPVGK